MNEYICWMNNLQDFGWINSLNEYYHCVIEWIIEWIKKIRYSQEKWTKCENHVKY